MLTPVLGNLGTLMVATLPLVLCWYVFHGLGSDDNDAISEVLIRDLISDRPILLSSRSPLLS